MKNLIMITPEQSRGARGLLSWGRPDLSRESKIGIATIAAFELGERSLTTKTMNKLVGAFTKHGITFENTAKKITVSLETENL